MAATHFDSIYLLVFLFVCKLTFPRGWQLKFANFTFFLFALTYLLIRLSFSLFLDFWTFLFSYFLPHPPSISTPFSHLLPALENGVNSNIDILLAPLSYRTQISMSPLPTFYFHSHSYLSLFLTCKKIFLLLSFCYVWLSVIMTMDLVGVTYCIHPAVLSNRLVWLPWENCPPRARRESSATLSGWWTDYI